MQCKHCNTLHKLLIHATTCIATILQHPATHYSTLQHTAQLSGHRHGMFRDHPATHCNTLQHTATHCSKTAAHCNVLIIATARLVTILLATSASVITRVVRIRVCRIFLTPARVVCFVAERQNLCVKERVCVRERARERDGVGAIMRVVRTGVFRIFLTPS